MSKWNRKINPKITDETQIEDDTVIPRIGSPTLKKPNTALNSTRRIRLKSSVNNNKIHLETFRSNRP